MTTAPRPADSMPAPDRRRFGHGWYPYLVPYAAFLVLIEIGRRAPESAAGVFLVLKVAVPAALFLWYWRQGGFPELRRFRPRAAELAADVAVGLGITALWMGPFVLGWLEPPDPGDAFDPAFLGPSWAPFVLAVRLIGFAAVTPFVEELFVRSFVLRLSDVYVYRRPRDFRDIPIGRFTWASFGITVLWFTFTHVPWEWPVAFAAGVIYNLWLYHRKHIGAVVLAHAVTNFSLFATVVLASGRVPDGQGGTLDLWYFL